MTAESLIVVDWQASGWKYLQVADTDTTDRSGTGFDDSGWATGSAAFGYGTPTNYPAPTSNWTPVTRLWLRRAIATAPGRSLTINVRVEALADVYWNGAHLGVAGDAAGDMVREGSLTVDGSLVTGSDVLAVRGTDNGTPASSGGKDYLDVQVVKS